LTYFYCDFRDSNYRVPVNVVGSIIGQLVMQETNIPENLLDLYEMHSKSRARLSLQALLDLLANVLEGTSGLRRTYIIVDAVDECTDREDLLAGLSVPQSLLDLKVNILVARRGENDFKDAFDGLPSLVLRPLLGRIYDEDLILLSASLNAGVGTVEGSGVQGEEDEGIRCMSETLQKKIERLILEGDKRWNIFMRNN
jgi:hypothetical protein